MFYKWDGVQLQEVASVYAPGFTLTIDTRGDFTYPRDGWYWFDTLQAAQRHFGLPSPEPDGTDLVAYATFKRWQKEVGGVTLNGVPVPTDDRAKLLILGAAQTMAVDDVAPLVISGVNYGEMSGAQFRAINAAVVAHVQATFPILAGVLEAITAGAITTTAAIDAAFA